ncbi:MarC family protein [Amylibacter sp. SFDW26]|uniref:MarC family protein n=1 Tax=Amylibacter sp. SFDW26 TaxID=2652722 RepID=UPI0012629CE8|nr:MarC family protein [Amylibacter sp. SFDW26]KAB7615825.1 MarC family protein [Amylibacter sp. SFDW26]
MIEFYITAFVTLFLVIDPIGLLPMFISLTVGHVAKRTSIAIRACLIAIVILAIFGLVGEKLLDFIGIGLPAFRISGGLLLFLIAVEMLFNKRGQRREEQSEEADQSDDPSVFPLATPLIAGPGAMAAMILLASDMQNSPRAVAVVMAAMISVVALVGLGFLMGNILERLLGKTGINVITRLMGMLLAALSVQFVVDGMHGLGVL